MSQSNQSWTCASASSMVSGDRLADFEVLTLRNVTRHFQGKPTRSPLFIWSSNHTLARSCCGVSGFVA